MWGDKPYYSLDYFLKNKFNEKVKKLSIDGGFTCPNRDGTLSFEGCIFCSEKGSGDFTSGRFLSITDQISAQKLKINGRCKYIAYFQSFTNTYDTVANLKNKYYEAVSTTDVVSLAVATRPDCLYSDNIALLKELNNKLYTFVELGFQTSNEKTALLINRYYKNERFLSAVAMLNEAHIDIVAHIIIGLPGEKEEDILNTIKFLSKLKIKGIKLQLLHVIKNTKLGNMYTIDPFHILSKNEYVNLVIKCLEHLRPDIVVHRLTGDGSKDSLIAPIWSLNKRSVLNSIHKELKLRGSYQGKCYVV